MKHFRNNLHSAFFFPGSNGYSENPERHEELSEEELIEQQTRENLDEHREQVQEQEFPNVAWEVASRVSSKYTDVEQLKRDRTRFQERVKTQNLEKKVYWDVWTQKITEGFWFLITSLKENGYFKNKNEAEEVAKIKELYTNEVYAQYEKNIWSAGNKTFNSIKDTIFWPNSEEYPANKIYTELTWAASISRVDRRYTEWYDTDVLEPISLDGVEEASEDMSERQNRNFLSDDLPQYLWDIKKTPGIVNVLKWLPIFSVKEDRPSKVDRKAIKQFLKVSSKIEVEWDKDKALALMEVLHDNTLNTNSWEDDYKAVLAKHGVKVEDKYIDDIVKVGSFYIKTQSDNNSARDQHAIYLSVLTAIEKKGWVKNTVNYFKPMVEQAKKDKKTERKEWYESGEKLWSTNPELYEIAKNLKITDFTSATRLSEKKSEYFEKNSIEEILANLNNDRMVDAWDVVAGWSKSGVQFLEIFKQVWKEKALPNLVERARLVNKTLWVGLPDALFNNAETVESYIKDGHTGLILLLQDVISKPGEDLYTLLSGKSTIEKEDLEIMTQARASAKEILTEANKNMDKLKEDGLTLPTPESMQSWLATALYTEYKRWIWLWNKISFDEWIKWLEMNTGFQFRNDGTVMVWIGLDYSKKINLWKGWSTTPELSAWAFIPLWMGKIEKIAGSAWINDEIAKEWITKKWIYEHLGVRGGVTLMPAGVFVLSVWVNWDENKLEWIDPREQQMKWELVNKVMNPILEDVAKTLASKWKTKLDFNDPEVVSILRQSILMKAKDEKVPSDKQEMVTDAVMRLLISYNNIDLSQEWAKDLISQWVAEQYAMAWAEDRKAHITDKAYLSWASLGVFWVVGSPLVWLYAWIKITKHDADGYGDRMWRVQEIHHEYQWEWNEKMIGNLNQQLWLSDNEKLRIENGVIVVSKSLAHRVNVNIKMKWLMKKDEKGNILLHPQTPMTADIRRWTATQWSELIIWWREGGQYAKLDTLWAERFTTEDINQNDILELGEGISTYSSEVITNALANLKAKFPAWDPIQSFELTEEEMTALVAKLNALDKTKKAKLVIAVNEEWKLQIKDPVEWDTWRWLEIKYQAKLEMIDSQVRDVLESVYTEADKVTCNVLNLMCHHLKWYKDRRRPEYMQFAEAMNNQDYKAAKPLILVILRRLDTEINKQQKNKVNFSGVATKIEAMTDEISLWQALMSVNNIFARSIKVIWKWQEEIEGKKISKYGLTLSMGNVIEERENQIKWTVSEKVEEPWRSAYLALIEASKKYRLANKKKFNVRESRAAQLENTVWFNLWNSVNPENPLFNPEIYEQMVDMKDLEKHGFSAEQRNALHERTMKLYAENSALINPILKALWLEGKEVKIKKFEMVGEKWKLELDIWWKKVTLSAWMKFGYFTQCVNHTVILEWISAETEDGASVKFNSGVWGSDRNTEWSVYRKDSTTEYGLSVSVIVHDGTERPWEENSNVKSDKDDEWGKSPDSNTNTDGNPDEEIVTPPTVTDDESISGGTPSEEL